MKKLLIAALALTALVACDKKESDKNLHLSGKVEGLKQGKLYIQHIVDTSLVTLDSITVEGDSNFKSELQISEPEMLYLTLNRGVSKSIDNVLPFFAEPGTMTIETTLKEFYAKAKITGSKNNDLYSDFMKIRMRYNDEQNKTLSLSLLAKKVNNAQKLDSLNQRADKLTVRNYLDAINFAVNNGKHEVAPYIALTEIHDANIKYLDTIQKSMSPEVAKSKYGKQLTTFIAERKKLEQTQN
ncbi:putative lipoprotein [Flavobacterium enshiense DK69]|uniref:DUF4369 domain-containing protein n=1 Tax=Flavobacterium enshiense DK69 TaxID=1107311 RepID=V6S7I5_9FLAO|nr:DUF4369 domain-containing protein [Flavobacterium enshiense]ESU22212.1 putative lipoprotein [Flavobacterium enshiense DK69]KGO97226.1 hypothetical protein Q767_01070 [Flavobacterium enshiense DK69]